jgi:hypothetical protein
MPVSMPMRSRRSMATPSRHTRSRSQNRMTPTRTQIPAPTCRRSRGTRSSRPREPFFPRHDINQEIELVRLGERLGDVGAGKRAPLVGVGDDECTGSDFGDEDLLLVEEGKTSEGREERGFEGGDVLSQALQKRMGATKRTL